MLHKTRVTSMMESFNGPHSSDGPAHSPISESATADGFKPLRATPMYGRRVHFYSDGKEFFWLSGTERGGDVSRAAGEGIPFSVKAGDALFSDSIERAAKGAKMYKSLRDVEAAATKSTKAMAMREEGSVDEGRTDYTKMDFSLVHKGVKHELHKEIIDHVLNDPKTIKAVAENGLDLSDEATLRNLVTNILSHVNVKRRGSTYRITLEMALGTGQGRVSFKRDMTVADYEALLESVTARMADAELSEAGIQKSSWPEFVEQAEKGLAYLGSKFNFSVEEMVDNIKRNKIDPKKLYADRKLVGGTSRLRMSKLDKNGKAAGASNLDKVGKVFRFGDFFIVYNEKDGNNVIAYGIPTSANEGLNEARVPTVKSKDDWVLIKGDGSSYGVGSWAVVGVRKASTNAPGEKVMDKLGADRAMRFGVLAKEFKGFKGYDAFMKQLKIDASVEIAEGGYEDYPVNDTTADLTVAIQKAVEKYVSQGPLKSYTSSVSARMASILQALGNRDLAMGEFMMAVDKLLDKAKK